MQPASLVRQRAGWRDPHATAYRLFTSQHVKDLRVIIYGAVLLLLSAGGIALVQGGFWAFIAPVLAVFGAVVAWAYQVGSARLGVVDLFACEISTLCRVAAVVSSAQKLIENCSQGPPSSRSHVPAATHFTSQENYFPVFENNSRDLQTLEANVVINITAFYTYMKATRDALRKLADMGPDSADLDSARDQAQAAGVWRKEARNAVYLLFLGLESARRAISDLVEFEPEKAERTIVVLLSELAAYGFLRCQFPDENDIFHRRIALRLPEYGKLVVALRSSVEAGLALGEEGTAAASWQEAGVLLPALDETFEKARRNLPEGGVAVARAGAGF
ncbi:MAG TPA: hypothetical protein VH640_02610 [Bryobacteraceae bacterium]